MKNFLVSILAILYLSASIGISFRLHYCMGKKTGWDIVSHQKDNCEKCGMTKKGGCCHDSNTIFKIDADQQLTAIYVSSLPIFDPILFSAQLYQSEENFTSYNGNKLALYDPPEFHGVPTHIFICVYRV